MENRDFPVMIWGRVKSTCVPRVNRIACRLVNISAGQRFLIIFQFQLHTDQRVIAWNGMDRERTSSKCSVQTNRSQESAPGYLQCPVLKAEDGFGRGKADETSVLLLNWYGCTDICECPEHRL